MQNPIVSNTKKKRRKISSRRPAVPVISQRHADIHPLDRAIAELRAELARTPDDSTLLGRIGALYYRRGDLHEAENYYRKAISLSPGKHSLYNNLGNVLCDMGRMRDGIASYEQAIAIDKARDPERPVAPEALTNLELARTEYRLVHERIEYLERAAQLEVTSAEALNALGCGYLLRGDSDRALDAFRKAADMDARNPYAGLNLAFVHTLNLSGPPELKETLAEVAAFIMRFPNLGRLHVHQGELLESAGMLEGAEERFLRAIQVEPYLLEAYDLLGRLRQAAGFSRTRDQSVQTVEETLENIAEAARQRRARDGNAAGPGPLYDLAFVAVARARFTCGAIVQPASVDALLREASLEQEGNLKERLKAAFLRAQLLETEGRRPEAQLILDTLCKRHPENPKVWFERGGLAIRSGDIAQAVSDFEAATLRDPQEALAYHSLRFAFEGFRRYKTEQVRFETAIKANPRDGLAHHHLGLAALSVLKNDEALFHFTRALELDPRLSDAACGRGRILHRVGHLEDAECAYEKALDIDPENAEAQRSLIGLRTQKLLTKSAKG